MANQRALASSQCSIRLSQVLRYLARTPILGAIFTFLFVFYLLLYSPLLFVNNEYFMRLNRYIDGGIHPNITSLYKPRKHNSNSNSIYFQNFDNSLKNGTKDTAPILSYAPLRKMETAHVDCGRILRGDVNYTTFIAKKRPLLVHRNKSDDCYAVRKRVLPPVQLKELAFGIAYARNVYRDYEFIEDELRSSYHPQNYFCYSIDQKADKHFKRNIKNLAKCFSNVVVTVKFKMDAAGHYTNHAHYECMQLLRQKQGWGYLLLLQNHDVIIKSQYEIVEIYKLLGGANDVEIGRCPQGRINHSKKWDALSLNLFKNPLNMSSKQLNAKLNFAKGAVQASLSRAAVEWMVDVANLTTLMNQLNEMPFGIDEILMQSLQTTDDLEMPGRFTSECLNKGKYSSHITRLCRWVYDSKCRSGYARKAVCILGIEDFQPLSQCVHIMANKMLPEFDYSIVECVHEMIFNRTFLGQIDQPLNASYYLNMANVKYNAIRNHQNSPYKVVCS